jgi:hypothetical protein
VTFKLWEEQVEYGSSLWGVNIESSCTTIASLASVTAGRAKMSSSLLRRWIGRAFWPSRQGQAAWIGAPYIALDVGQVESGEWIIIETGDPPVLWPLRDSRSGVVECPQCHHLRSGKRKRPFGGSGASRSLRFQAALKYSYNKFERGYRRRTQ